MKNLKQKIKSSFKSFTGFIHNVSKYLKRTIYQFWLFIMGKNFDLKIHGDSVERDKYEFIDEILSNYKYFWSSFIGHDQKGNICSSNINNIDLENKRKYIGQLYYSIIRKFIQLKLIIDDIKDLNEIDNVDNHLKLTSLISSYLSTFGQIFDKEQKILLTLKIDKNRQEKTSKYYEGIRNFEQHSSDIPIIMVENLIGIPSTFFLIGNDKLSWFKPIDEREIVFLDDFINNLYNKIHKQVNNNLSVVKEKLKKLFPNFQFQYPDLSIEQNKFVVSGITGTYNYIREFVKYK